MLGAKKIGILVVALVAVVLVARWLGSTPPAPPGEPPAPTNFVFTWTAPTKGTTAVSYDVEIRQGGADSDDVTHTTSDTNEILVEVTNFLVKYEVRVRGVDDQGRRGPWSEWSLEYDRGLPAAGL